jgi:hypothetical protein
MKPVPPAGDIPRLPGLARRSHRLSAAVTAGPPLQLTVRYQGRRYPAQIYHPGTGRAWRIHRASWQRAAAAGSQRRARRARGQPG